jgi:hypothetical protein
MPGSRKPPADGPATPTIADVDTRSQRADGASSRARSFRPTSDRARSVARRSRRAHDLCWPPHPRRERPSDASTLKRKPATSRRAHLRRSHLGRAYPGGDGATDRRDGTRLTGVERTTDADCPVSLCREDRCGVDRRELQLMPHLEQRRRAELAHARRHVVSLSSCVLWPVPAQRSPAVRALVSGGVARRSRNLRCPRPQGKCWSLRNRPRAGQRSDAGRWFGCGRLRWSPRGTG